MDNTDYYKVRIILEAQDTYSISEANHFGGGYIMYGIPVQFYYICL